MLLLFWLVAILSSRGLTVASDVRNDSVGLARSFFHCVSSARQEHFSAGDRDDESTKDEILARAITCMQLPIARGINAVADARGGDLALWNGTVVLKRTDGPGVLQTSENPPTEFNLTDLASTHDIITQLDVLSRSYKMEVSLYPGVNARIGRAVEDQNSVDLTFRLDGIFPENERSMDDEDGDEDVNEGDEVDEPRHKHKKKKFLKKLKKKVKKYLPLLVIPLALQLLLLPLYMMTLKIMALKSIFLGKMTLLLLMLNVFRNIQQRQDEDERNAQIASEYYGLSDGVEYGAWFNSRKRRRRRSNNDPYFLSRPPQFD